MSEKMDVAIIDYGLGNLHNIQRALRFVGAHAVITDDPKALMKTPRLILPGVGAFGDGMEGLRRRNLVNPIQECVAMNKPILGICLGMQLMFTSGEEFGRHEGLNLIEGDVVRLENPHRDELHYKIPHVGWNAITPQGNWTDSILAQSSPGDFVYFVHSYICVPRCQDQILATTRYGHNRFCSVIRKRNVWGCQFHPEKSSHNGLVILKQFVSLPLS